MRTKKGLFFSSVLLSLCLMLSSCASVSDTPSGREEVSTDAVSSATEPTFTPPAQRPVFLQMGTGSVGGTYFTLGGAIAACLNHNLDDVGVQSYATNASIENIYKLQSGELDLGFSMNSTAHAAWNGTESFTEDGPQREFRAIAAIYPEVVQIVASSESGASTLPDLEGKRLAVGPAGSGGAVTVEMLLAAAGLDLYTDLDPLWESFSDGVAKMQNGEIDASSIVVAIPSVPVMELFSSMDVQFVEISDEELETLQQESPYYTRYIITPDVYGTDSPVYTATCQAVLYCRADLDDDTVYQVTKAFFESADDIAGMNSNGQFIHVNNAFTGLTTPLHSGAVRYYSERGVTVPSNLIIE